MITNINTESLKKKSRNLIKALLIWNTIYILCSAMLGETIHSLNVGINLANVITIFICLILSIAIKKKESQLPLIGGLEIIYVVFIVALGIRLYDSICYTHYLDKIFYSFWRF